MNICKQATDIVNKMGAQNLKCGNNKKRESNNGINKPEAGTTRNHSIASRSNSKWQAWIQAVQAQGFLILKICTKLQFFAEGNDTKISLYLWYFDESENVKDTKIVLYEKGYSENGKHARITSKPLDGTSTLIPK